VNVKAKEPEKPAAGGRTSRAYEQRYPLTVRGRLPPGARIAEEPVTEMWRESYARA
jgi:hypothetical protein